MVKLLKGYNRMVYSRDKGDVFLFLIRICISANLLDKALQLTNDFSEDYHNYDRKFFTSLALLELAEHFIDGLVMATAGR